MKKITLILVLFLLAKVSTSQVNLDLEMGSIHLYEQNCWILDKFHLTNNSISGQKSLETDQMNTTNPNECYIETPWIYFENTTPLTFKYRFNNNTGSTRTINFYSITYPDTSKTLFHSMSFSNPANPFPTTTQSATIAIPQSLFQTRSKIKISFMGTGNNSRLITDNYVFPGIYYSAPHQNCGPLPEPIVDTDNDNVPDDIDEYPNDSLRAFSSYFPSQSQYGTLAFEDQWPERGDYDFNDVVIDYKIKTITNSSNRVSDFIVNFKLKASGAGFSNGFGVQLDGVSPNKVNSVSIDNQQVSLESGQSKAVVILFQDFFDKMSAIGGGYVGVNTSPNAEFTPYVDTQLHFILDGTIENSTLNQNSLNYFIYIDKDRGRELHLPDRIPTDKANPTFFSSGEDDSKPETNRYYKTQNNLPWAINIIQGFQYPVEKTPINLAYLKFIQWAMSNGNSYPDWYINLPGYRDSAKIY